MVTANGRNFILREGKLEKISKNTTVFPGYEPSVSPTIAFSRRTSKFYYVPKGHQLELDDKICKFRLSDLIYIKYS